MRIRSILVVAALVILAFGVGRLSAAVGTLDSPDVPGNTWSFTLEDIWNRLNSGAAGVQSAFTDGARPGDNTVALEIEGEGVVMSQITARYYLLSEDLNALVEKDVISRYELTGRQIIVYLENLESGQLAEFGYRLRARFPLRAKMPRSMAHD